MYPALHVNGELKKLNKSKLMLLKYTKGGSYDSIYKCTYFLRIICQQKAHHTWKVWYFLHVRKFLSRRFHQPHSKHGFILLPIGFIRTSKLYMANFYFSSNKVSCIAFLIIKEIRIYFWKTKDKIKRILKKKKASERIPTNWNARCQHLGMDTKVADGRVLPQEVLWWLNTGSMLCSLQSSHLRARNNPLPSS